MGLFGVDGSARVEVSPGDADFGRGERVSPAHRADEDFASVGKVLLPRPSIGGCARAFGFHGGDREGWWVF